MMDQDGKNVIMDIINGSINIVLYNQLDGAQIVQNCMYIVEVVKIYGCTWCVLTVFHWHQLYREFLC